MPQKECPVCGSQRIASGGSVCPRCKTDVNLWHQVIDLPYRYFDQALQLIKVGQLKKAKDKLTASLTLFPGHTDSQLLLGRIFAELGMYDEAISLWKKALRTVPGNPREIEDLIIEAQKRQAEIVAKENGEQKRGLEATKEEERRRVRSRWIMYSILFSTAALLIGVLLPYPLSERPSNQSTATIPKPTDYKQAVQKVLKARGISGVQVTQKNSTIYLSGRVTIPQEKYELEDLLRSVEGVSALDLTGIEVLHPRGHYYTVRKSDNLWMVAERVWGDGTRLEEIHQVNRQLIRDPSKISPGTTIIIPE